MLDSSITSAKPSIKIQKLKQEQKTKKRKIVESDEEGGQEQDYHEESPMRQEDTKENKLTVPGNVASSASVEDDVNTQNAKRKKPFNGIDG